VLTGESSPLAKLIVQASPDAVELAVEDQYEVADMLVLNVGPATIGPDTTE
jgi:hypothetical protein